MSKLKDGVLKIKVIWNTSASKKEKLKENLRYYEARNFAICTGLLVFFR
jgi:hypothetical protein